MTYREYCAAVERARHHPESLRAGLEENGLRLITYEAGCALDYAPHMTHQIWPQRDALVYIVSKDQKRAGSARTPPRRSRSLQAPGSKTRVPTGASGHERSGPRKDRPSSSADKAVSPGTNRPCPPL